jgi:chromosome partitioning protein
MVTISVVNQKGGVGKTTLVVNLVAAINKIGLERKLGINQLVIDADPQGNASDTLLGNEVDITNANVAKLFDAEIYNGFDVIYKTRFDHIDIIPSNIQSSKKEFYSVNILDGHRRFKYFLQLVEKRYDLCIIDCPPSLGLFSLNALCASDFTFIPAVPERYSIIGIKDLLHTVSVVRPINPDLKVLGIIPTIVDRRYRLHNEMLEELKKNFNDAILDDLTISTNSNLKNSTALKKTIFECNYNPKTYKQFMRLAKWILEVTRVQRRASS